MGEVRERIALRSAALVGDGFVTASERYWLEREETDLLGVVEGELDDASNLLVVDAIHNRDNGNDLDTRAMEVVDGLQLNVEQVTHLAVCVGSVADTIELQIRVPHAGFSCLLGELEALGELDTIGSRLHAVVTDLASVAHRVQEVRR